MSIVQTAAFNLKETMLKLHVYEAGPDTITAQIKSWQEKLELYSLNEQVREWNIRGKQRLLSW